MGRFVRERPINVLQSKKKTRTLSRSGLEVPPRFELGDEAFAELCLTTWPWHRIWSKLVCSKKFGASDEARTRYLHLGKVALYQMSYTRIYGSPADCSAREMVPPVGIEPTTRGFSVLCSTN